ncbi:muscle, skeletal receptor tyrosine protein kinase-like isoform X2 [Hydractinia symbiolongicarpus]|nr:muscle, skeletal receptor tyrosine protein kinase-like isoform X2 [Hydractinia symbiolongicarpus]
MCSHLPKFKTNLENITEVYKEKISLFFSCFSYDIKWILCHLTHSVCLQSNVDASVILSPPCKSTCVNDKCFALFKHVYNLMKDLRSICRASIPRLNDSRFNLNCQALPEANVTYFERCQNKEDSNQNFTKYCYEGNGSGYIGIINVTSSGKTCQPWSINPYLDSGSYPTLKENFCRNPQGHLDKPWCYIDKSMQRWEYCDVKECSSNMIIDKESWMNNVWMILTSLGVIIVLLVIAYFYKRHRKQRRNEQETMVPAYLDFKCKGETLSKLLSPPQIETEM